MCYYNDIKVRPLFETTDDTKEQMWHKRCNRVEYSKLGENGIQHLCYYIQVKTKKFSQNIRSNGQPNNFICLFPEVTIRNGTLN